MDKKKLHIKLPQIRNDIQNFLNKFPRINRNKKFNKEVNSPIIKHTIVKLSYISSP